MVFGQNRGMIGGRRGGGDLHKFIKSNLNDKHNVWWFTAVSHDFTICKFKCWKFVNFVESKICKFRGEYNSSIQNHWVYQYVRHWLMYFFKPIKLGWYKNNNRFRALCTWRKGILFTKLRMNNNENLNLNLWWLNAQNMKSSSIKTCLSLE